MSMVVCEMRGNNLEHETSMCEMSMCERRYSGEMRDDETRRTISRFNLFLFGLFPFPSCASFSFGPRNRDRCNQNRKSPIAKSEIRKPRSQFAKPRITNPTSKIANQTKQHPVIVPPHRLPLPIRMLARVLALPQETMMLVTVGHLL